MNSVRAMMPLSSLWCYDDSWLRTFNSYLLKFLGYIFWFSAAVVALVGVPMILIYRNYRSLFQESFLYLSGWLAVATAITLLPIGLLAISVSAKSSRYKQGALMYLLLVLLCLAMSSAVLAQFSLQTTSKLKTTMGYLVSQYNGTPSKDPGSGAVDKVQRRLRCCGVGNYTDWLKTTASSWHLPAERHHVPESCCKERHSDCTGDLNHLDQIFQEGCLKKLEDWFDFLMLYVFWCSVVLSVLGLVTTVINGLLKKYESFHSLQFLDSYTFI
ncbi:tetraspanin-3-like [Indicator indicator]|uniref:tetraspanin-3-like n=1 Tax=Indicator indicator TaxID=1002788 RepID=UPI0023DF22BA|nr:tetraspanin-3-like [Indicator indicator]